jgi:hypothetical protein
MAFEFFMVLCVEWPRGARPRLPVSLHTVPEPCAGGRRSAALTLCHSSHCTFRAVGALVPCCGVFPRQSLSAVLLAIAGSSSTTSSMSSTRSSRAVWSSISRTRGTAWTSSTTRFSRARAAACSSAAIGCARISCRMLHVARCRALVSVIRCAALLPWDRQGPITAALGSAALCCAVLIVIRVLNTISIEDIELRDDVYVDLGKVTSHPTAATATAVAVASGPATLFQRPTPNPTPRRGGDSMGGPEGRGQRVSKLGSFRPGHSGLEHRNRLTRAHGRRTAPPARPGPVGPPGGRRAQRRLMRRRGAA